MGSREDRAGATGTDLRVGRRPLHSGNSVNEDELDRCYTALCEMLARLGENRSTLALAMLSLALISRYENADEVLLLLQQTESSCVP
jgi:hypothetical protein